MPITQMRRQRTGRGSLLPGVMPSRKIGTVILEPFAEGPGGTLASGGSNLCLEFWFALRKLDTLLRKRVGSEDGMLECSSLPDLCRPLAATSGLQAPPQLSPVSLRPRPPQVSPRLSPPSARSAGSACPFLALGHCDCHRGICCQLACTLCPQFLLHLHYFSRPRPKTSSWET